MQNENEKVCMNAYIKINEIIFSYLVYAAIHFYKITDAPMSFSETRVELETIEIFVLFILGVTVVDAVVILFRVIANR